MSVTRVDETAGWVGAGSEIRVTYEEPQAGDKNALGPYFRGRLKTLCAGWRPFWGPCRHEGMLHYKHLARDVGALQGWEPDSVNSRRRVA